MDKKFQEVKSFITDEKNRTTVIATAAGVFAIVAGIVMAKRGKAKRK